jgi:hypothetical protein
MNTEYVIWLGTGLIGAYILNRNPSKLVFGRNFEGAMLRSALSIIVLVSVMSGPFLLVVALLLPPKKLCPSCYSAVHQKETICPKCSAYVPDVVQEPKTAKEQITESQLSHFSPEVQAVVAKGYKDVSLVSAFLMIGTFITTIVLGVFVIDDKSGIFTGSGLIFGFVLGWLWWSYSVPRWREWALKQPGINPDELQKAAEVATLVWPKGHFFEKTEFRIKKK